MSQSPTILARFDERPRLALLRDGSLIGLFVRWHTGGQELAARRSTDGGVTWSDPESGLALAPEPGRWGGCQVVVDNEGALHAFLMNDRNSGVFADAEGGRKGGAGERFLDVWHSCGNGGPGAWSQPRRIWEGYTGSLNGGLCTSSGRLVLPFARSTSRTWRDRGDGLDAFTFYGTSSSMVVYSDDGGDTWHQTPSELKVQTPCIGTYGAVEPVVVERADGRLWMLIRTQVGRLYESYSDDGVLWSHPRPTHLISSDSPVGMVRLPDGRLTLLWNKCRRYPYAHGGRHVLHGALSDDDGITWTGHREVARDPHRDEPPPPGGDHGTAYPYPVVAADGSVLVTTGQGAGRVCIVRIDPAWLAETGHAWPEGAAEPADEWSTFGCRGVEVRPDEDGGGKVALSMALVDGDWPAAAAWNFPLAARGRLDLRLKVQDGFGGALILLTDHYSVPFDPEDVLEAPLGVALEPVDQRGSFAGDTLGPRAAGPERLPAGVASCRLQPGAWHELQFTWDLARGGGQLRVNGQAVCELPRRRVSEGVCYLRLRSTSRGPDGGLTVAAVSAAAE